MKKNLDELCLKIILGEQDHALAMKEFGDNCFQYILFKVP